MVTTRGKVYLIGAGPGDPGLITVKGADRLRRADVVVYDYLASPALLAHAPREAELIYVGKKGGDHTLSQEGINALIVQKAREGGVVARLKGGDPFIFGRGGEEVEELVAAGVPFEVVPGVTSTIAAPAYAGIPLTHRKYTASLAFVTGHEDPDKESSLVDWKALAAGVGTLVYVMGVKNLPNITRRLMENGRAPETPAALIRWGTTSRQETVTGTVENIVERAKAAGLKAPAVFVVGEVVGLRKTMQWFERRPLFGKRIVVTRAREQASDLVQRLSDLGAECLEHPTIRVEPPGDMAPLDQAIADLAQYQWIVFTSVNGVKFFFDRLFELGLDVRALGDIRTASIGPATADRLLSYGLKSDIIPESYRAESVVEAFTGENVQGKRILLPRAMEARPVLPVELGKMGARVDEIAVYRTRRVQENTDLLLERLREGDVDLVTFTSSSTAKNFTAMLPPGEAKDLLRGVVNACIGPVTADTARALGLDVHVVADQYTIPGLCDAILAHFK
ncbi:MAG: uroporphyrinogen-III C-methyltransferase [Desulfobacterales bacterium]|nr:uroporphyrinogen-III C-methyltransferase [Desulfobacterales bacterium]